MYHIFKEDGSSLGYVDTPLYIRVGSSGCYTPTDAAHAEGVAVRGTPYSLMHLPNPLEGAEETVGLKEVDGGAVMNETEETVAETSEAVAALEDALCDVDAATEETTEAVAALEDALCDIDAATEDRLTAIEDALCDLDAAVSE